MSVMWRTKSGELGQGGGGGWIDREYDGEKGENKRQKTMLTEQSKETKEVCKE